MYNENEYNRRKYSEYDRHINNAEQYRDYVRNLKWNKRKGSGERWNMDELIKRSDIDFNREEFTPYDFAYMVNAEYANYNISEKPDYYMEMAKDDLHNDNYPERAGERAYYDALRRSERYNGGYNYNGYNNYNNRYDGRYESRYEYRNSNRDRDNDGRYNE